MSHQKGFSSVLIVIIIAVLIGSGFLYYQNWNKPNTNQSQTVTPIIQSSPTSYKHNPNDTSGIGDFLKYPNMTFVDEQVVLPCSTNDEFNPCGAIVYNWKTPDKIDQVNSWYEIDKRNYGFSCQIGSQSKNTNFPENKITCSANRFSYVFLITSNGNQTTIKYSIPTSFTNYKAKNALEQTAYDAMDSYLKSYKQGNEAGNSKISDYLITNISNVSENGDSLSFGVNFSIKPTSRDVEPIGTDNGIPTIDGWDRNKGGGAIAKKIDGKYVIQGIGTGFGSK